VTGAFIVLEGGDHSGKTTHSRLLAERLAADGFDVVHTRQPGGTDTGLAIRKILLDPRTGDLDARAEALLYAADKAHHVHEVIGPAMARGAVVVCDRYVDSTLAYQGAGRVLDSGDVEWIARWATRGLRPDLTVLLDVAPDAAVHRKTDKDRLEDAGIEFHLRVRQEFLTLAERDPKRYLVLGGMRDLDATAEAIHTRARAILSELGVTLNS
jgi:dTMP kinase